MSDRIIPQNTDFGIGTFKLTSDGKDITNDYAILSFVVDRVVNRIPTARVILKDGSAAEETFAASDGNDFTPGKELEISVGFDGNNRPIFKGLIVKQAIKVGVDGNTRLIIDCRDAATKLTVGRHSQYFTESKDSEAIEAIIDNYSGVSAQVETTRITHPKIVQYYSTDWDFLLSRAEMNGQIVLIEDGKINIKAPTTSGSPLITLTYGANLIELEAEMDARDQYQAVKAVAWSYADQALVEATASEPSINDQGNLSGRILAEVIGLSELELHHGGEVTQPELQAWANAQLLKSRLAKIRGRVKTQGYPEAKPDALIELGGTGARFNGPAYVSGIRHDFSGGVWQTHMQLGLAPDWFYQRAQNVIDKPASGLLPGVNGLQTGVVTQLQDDPKGEDRILVKAPVVDTRAEGIWARVATLDAGQNRGSFFRPEIGDEVVLGFLNEDPRDAIVLGMLNSSAKPAPLAATDDNHQKGFVTRSEIKLLFDDETKVITLETPGGNKLIISDEAKGISLEDQNGNILTLNDSGIALSSPKDITFEATGKLTLKASQDISLEGLNVNAKANAQFKAEGSAGAEVSTSAIAVLKGSLVQIN
ncbi:MAG: type VI secretion system tip protein VgrG [Leptolyngbya sp. SIO4C1]|nr:type VI secretion system tip protein VgrG [Leptolyngbya sp. SIO4C1]